MYCKPGCLQASGVSGKQQRCMQLSVAYCKRGRWGNRGQQECSCWCVSAALWCLFGATQQTVHAH